MAYQPIENYGMIGDLHTVALVGMNGSIDWLCIPNFDSPSAFAAILDDDKGGRFRIAPVDERVRCKQFYWPETNVLVTRFLAPHGATEVTDFMPVGGGTHTHQLVRWVMQARGTGRLRMECTPAFNFARDRHTVAATASGVEFRSADLHLGLDSSLSLNVDGAGAVAEFTLNEGETAEFVLHRIEGETRCRTCVSRADAQICFNETVTYWRHWLSKCSYRGRWREMVHRSALALKLMTYEPTGAIVAAPTCSLPEGIGGERNWDYRYTWIRDSAFVIYAFLRLGFTEEAERFMEFISCRCREPNPDHPLQIMYGIDGRHTLTEQTLDHLAGYRGSKPVRVGNGAYDQLQLDVYGELLDAVYLFNKHGAPISYDLWS